MAIHPGIPRISVSALVAIVAHAAFGLGAADYAPLFVPGPGSSLVVGQGVGNLAIADLNDDGWPDLVVTGGQSPSLTVFLGGGGGSFAAGRRINLADAPSEIALGDLDGDGHQDLVLASHDSYAVTLLLGDGRGGLTLSPRSPLTIGAGEHPHAHGLAVHDLNGDGKLDILTVNNEDNNLALAMGDGRGGFTRSDLSPIPVGPSPYGPAIGDIDGDGHDDIVVPDTGTGEYYRTNRVLARTISIVLGDGAGGFRPPAGSPLSVEAGPYFVALGDLDGTGSLDLVATHNDSRRMTVLLNNGAAGFRSAPSSPVQLGQSAFAVVIHDMNGDGRADLVAATNTGVSVLLGDGRGMFGHAPGSPFRTQGDAWRIAVGDLNRDGKPDIAATSLGAGSVTVLLSR